MPQQNCNRNGKWEMAKGNSNSRVAVRRNRRQVRMPQIRSPQVRCPQLHYGGHKCNAAAAAAARNGGNNVTNTDTYINHRPIKGGQMLTCGNATLHNRNK